MAKPPLHQIEISHIFSTKGPADAPYNLKRFVGLIPAIQQVKWKVKASIKDFDLEYMEVNNLAASFLCIISKDDERRLPNRWLHFMVYHFNNAIILVDGDNLELYHGSLGNSTDTARFFTAINTLEDGRAFSKREFIPARDSLASREYPDPKPINIHRS